MRACARYGQGMGGARRDRGVGNARGRDLRVISGAGVVLVGLFSARQKDYARQMDEASGRVASLGGHVVARLVQRRGVSHGGAAAMSRPFSRKTLVSGGKAREIGAACDAHGAAVVVFLNPLSPHQEQALAELLGRPVVSLGEAGVFAPQAPGAPPRPPGSLPSATRSSRPASRWPSSAPAFAWTAWSCRSSPRTASCAASCRTPSLYVQLGWPWRRPGHSPASPSS